MERPAAARGKFVYGFSDETFSGPGRAFDKHVAVALGDGRKYAYYFFHLSALSDYVVESVFVEKPFFSEADLVFHEFAFRYVRQRSDHSGGFSIRRGFGDLASG